MRQLGSSADFYGTGNPLADLSKAMPEYAKLANDLVNQIGAYAPGQIGMGAPVYRAARRNIAQGVANVGTAGGSAARRGAGYSATASRRAMLPKASAAAGALEQLEAERMRLEQEAMRPTQELYGEIIGQQMRRQMMAPPPPGRLKIAPGW
jgi:hypothetical protein